MKKFAAIFLAVCLALPYAYAEDEYPAAVESADLGTLDETFPEDSLLGEEAPASADALDPFAPAPEEVKETAPVAEEKAVEKKAEKKTKVKAKKKAKKAKIAKKKKKAAKKAAEKAADPKKKKKKTA